MLGQSWSVASLIVLVIGVDHTAAATGRHPTSRWPNVIRERRRSAAMSLHDRPVAAVRWRFPRADVIRHTACLPAGHIVDCGRCAPTRVRDGSGDVTLAA